MDIFQNLFLNSEEYRNRQPYPHTYIDNALNSELATAIQQEILNIDKAKFDRYDNPFEQKYTLRDKFQYPELLNRLMTTLTSTSFLDYLSEYTGHKLINDEQRMYWGVHVYEPGDKLDIHVDAGFHPVTNQKKQITLGLYLSYNWKDTYGCDLEIWNGDNASHKDAKLHNIVTKIAPMFNRMILFTCDDKSWHGNPIPSTSPADSKRIFVTLSYLSDEINYDNKRKKAFFIARPTDEPDPVKDSLRELRADPSHCSSIYSINKM